MIYHLLYISEKTNHFRDSDIEEILSISQSKNTQKQLTGILIANGNFFIQLLEGKRETVMSTLNTIKGDERHSRLRVLMEFSDQHRLFPNWSMGLIDNKEYHQDINELVPLLHTDVIKLESSKEKALSILRKFNKL